MINILERADEIGKKAAKKAYEAAYKDALMRLRRSKPIIDALQQHHVKVFIDDHKKKQKGVRIVIEVGTAEKIFIDRIERITVRWLNHGTILFPCGFGKNTYAEQLRIIVLCKETLAIHQITSEIITKPEEGMVILFVQPSQE